MTATTISEIERGVLPAFSGRVLPFDLAAARILATYRVTEKHVA